VNFKMRASFRRRSLNPERDQVSARVDYGGVNRGQQQLWGSGLERKGVKRKTKLKRTKGELNVRERGR